MAECIFVLGFHRSGTSALTGALREMGVDAGSLPDERSLENPKGFHEHPFVRRLNERLFERFETAWYDWAFDAGEYARDFELLSGELDEACGFLKGHFSDSDRLVIKDPRLMVWLPLWEEAVRRVGAQSRKILIFRDPKECAASQVDRAKRNEGVYAAIDTADSMHALWCRYLSVFIRQVDGETALLSHEDLMTAPSLTLSRASEALELGAAEEDVARAARFIDPELYRANKGLADGVWSELSGPLHLAVRDSGDVLDAAVLRSTDALARIEAAFLLLAPARNSIRGYTRLRLSYHRDLAAARRGLINIFRTAVNDMPDSVLPEFLLHTEPFVTQPDHAPLFLAPRAMANRRLGRHAECRALLQALLKEDPDARWAQQILDESPVEKAHRGTADAKSEPSKS